MNTLHIINGGTSFNWRQSALFSKQTHLTNEAQHTCRRYVSCVSCSISESNSGTSEWSESDSSLLESANISVELVGRKKEESAPNVGDLEEPTRLSDLNTGPLCWLISQACSQICWCWGNSTAKMSWKNFIRDLNCSAAKWAESKHHAFC